jgi:hypothetical protein
MSSISTVAVSCASSHSRDDASTPGHHSNTIITSIGNIDVARCVHCDTYRATQLCCCRLSSISTVAVSCASSHSRDDASTPGHHSYTTRSIRNIDVARCIYCDTLRATQSCCCRLSAISTRATSSHSRDDASTRGHHSNKTMTFRNIDVARCVHCDTCRAIQLCCCRLSSISNVSEFSIASHSRDDASTPGHHSNSITITIGNIDVARCVHCDTYRAT